MYGKFRNLRHFGSQMFGKFRNQYFLDVFFRELSGERSTSSLHREIVECSWCIFTDQNAVIKSIGWIVGYHVTSIVSHDRYDRYHMVSSY